MTRPLRFLLLVAALLASQHAALLHGLAHAKFEIALAAQEGEKSPALDHGVDVCAAFGALAHALGNAVATAPCAEPRVTDHSTTPDSAFAAARIVFDSRAPPYLA